MDAKDIIGRVGWMVQQNAERDGRHRDILAIRDGDYEAVAPGLFPEEFDKPLIANLIDTAARDIAEVMAPLPSFNCQPAVGTDKARKFHDKRTKVARGYVDRSRLGVQFLSGGTDRFNTLGFMALTVEPDFGEQSPVIKVSQCASTYYVNDFFGRTRQYAEVYHVPAPQLCALYPEYDQQIKRLVASKDSQELKCIRWIDGTRTAFVLEELGVTLGEYEHRVKGCPVRVIERPTIGKSVRGQYDDVIWVQIARGLVANYTMDAVEQSVHAPLVVPDDVNQIEVGPGATLRTANPQGVGRVPLQISPGLFPESQMLAQEQRIGSRYPEGRSGNIDASIITGQGVQALMGTFDTQIKTFQELATAALADVIGMCFEMDEAWWPDVEKTVRGKDDGAPYEVTYIPSVDIAKDHTVDVSYGAIAGLDPNRALVFILQAQAAGLVSKDTAMRELPNVDINVSEEMKKIDQEAMRQGALGMFMAMPQLALQGMSMGQDPREYMQQLVDAMDMRSKGKSLEEIVKKIFVPKEQAQPAAPAMDPLAALMGGGGGAPSPEAGGAEALLMSLTGMTPEGDANLQSTVSRRQPV